MKSINFKILAPILIALFLVAGCSNHQYETPLQDAYWLPTPEIYFIPFDIIDNEVIIHAKINEVEGNISFEVNCRGVELSPYFHKKLAHSKESSEYNNDYNLFPSTPYQFEIGDLTYDLPPDLSVTVNSEARTDETILAYIGRDFFRNSEIAIDYNTQVLTVYNGYDSPITSLLLIG